MVELTIDGKKITVEPQTSIIEAARQYGINIPNLCYDRRLRPYGGCRICIVEIQGQRKLATACSTPVKAGMVVLTKSPRVTKIRKTLIELLLLHHPMDCPVCDKAGECALQDLAFEYGASQSRFSAMRRQEVGQPEDAIVARTMSRCISCGKCVNLCQQYQGAKGINFIGRGFKVKVGPAFEEPLDCEFCGQCIDICPVGALGSAPSRSRSRIWYEEERATICAYCGCGCTTHLSIREDRILRARGREDTGINKGDLCAKGRFGFDFVYGTNRLTVPLIKKEGKHVPSTWDEALHYVVTRLDAIKQAHGPAAIGALGSQRCTMEDNYMLQRFMREAIGSDNIDSSARFGYAVAQAAAKNVFGVEFQPAGWNAAFQADFIFVLESDITSALPVWALNFLRAKNEGATLVVADALDTKLAKSSSWWLQIRPGSGEALLKGIMRIMINERVALQQRASTLPNYNALVHSLEHYTPSLVSQHTGLAEQEIMDLARSYGDASRRLLAMTAGSSENRKGLNTLLSAANLVLLMGDNPATLQIPAEFCNTLGMWTVGVRPRSEGKDAHEMLYKAGSLKGLYIMGENPLVTFRQSELIENNLRDLEFLVVQDINFTETAKLADVVLPACSWGEKEGTFMNMTGVVQKMPRLLPVTGESLPDWQIFRNLARRMNKNFGTVNLQQIRNEINDLVIMLKRSRTTPPAFHPVQEKPQEIPDENFPLLLVVSDLLHHSGTMSTESRSLVNIVPDAYLIMHPADAEKYSINDDEFVRLTSKRGEVVMKATVSSEAMEGTVVASVHFPRVRINRVTHLGIDGETPLDAVRVEPVS